MKNLSDRLNYALKLTGTKKADLARAISVKPQVIQFLCNSQTQSSRFSFEIATALGLNTRWLATGDGQMFIADDPKVQVLKNYHPIPLLNLKEIKNILLFNKNIDESKIIKWIPLETSENDIVAIEMMDNSMEPIFPYGAFLFIKKIKFEILECKYVFLYLKKFDTFVVREVEKNNSDVLLVPKNKHLFKKILFSDEVVLLGIVTDCFWHIGNLCETINTKNN